MRFWILLLMLLGSGPSLAGSAPCDDVCSAALSNAGEVSAKTTAVLVDVFGPELISRSCEHRFFESLCVAAGKPKRLVPNLRLASGWLRLGSSTWGQGAATALGGDVEGHPCFVGSAEVWVHNYRWGDFHGPWRELPEKDIHWGRYLKRRVGKGPDGMYRKHAHHIFKKKGDEGLEQVLVEEGKWILRRRAGINHIYDLRNFVHAPNGLGVHELAETIDTLQGLRRLDAIGASPKHFEAFLRLRGANHAGR